jgi:hypothetical protein
MLDRAKARNLDPHDLGAAQKRRPVGGHADAAGRAGEDEAAGLERSGLADEADEVVEREGMRPFARASLAQLARYNPPAQREALGVGTPLRPQMPAAGLTSWSLPNGSQA